jgi:hypothetical protein
LSFSCHTNGYINCAEFPYAVGANKTSEPGFTGCNKEGNHEGCPYNVRYPQIVREHAFGTFRYLQIARKQGIGTFRYLETARKHGIGTLRYLEIARKQGIGTFRYHKITSNKEKSQ